MILSSGTKFSYQRQYSFTIVFQKTVGATDDRSEAYREPGFIYTYNYSENSCSVCPTILQASSTSSIL